MNQAVGKRTFKAIHIYVAGILLLAIAYGFLRIGDDFSLPDLTTWVLGTTSMLLVWQCGVRMPYLGMISMERLVQFHLLLTMPISETLAITTVASLIMPFINKSYRMNSYRIAAIRAINNLSMNIIMLLTGSWILSHWLSIPLTVLDAEAIYVIAGAALVMQVINIGMIFIYFSFDKKKISKLFTPAYIFADLVFVPAGVLSALLWMTVPMEMFILFALFMVVLLVSFHGFNQKTEDSGPITLHKGTEYPTSFLDINHVASAIHSRCDHLFNCQAIFLIEKDGKEGNTHFLLNVNNTNIPDLDEFAEQLDTLQDAELGQQFVGEYPIDFMVAQFVDHDGVFARMVLIRDNQVPYTNPDLNLLRLFVQRYRPGLSYALTFAKLSEYKSNLEEKVAERTQQLENANREKSDLVNKLKMISNSDALTQLYNRRFFDSMIKHFSAQPPPYLSLAILDIDHFKRINDSFGHEVGDQVLKTIAHVIKSWSSEGVTLVRYGGEEFVIVLKNCQLEQATAMLHQLLLDVSSFDWSTLALNQTVTVSIGLAGYPGTAVTDLFEQADAALYRAKANGRNQVQVHSNK